MEVIPQDIQFRKLGNQFSNQLNSIKLGVENSNINNKTSSRRIVPLKFFQFLKFPQPSIHADRKLSEHIFDITEALRNYMNNEFVVLDSQLKKFILRLFQIYESLHFSDEGITVLFEQNIIETILAITSLIFLALDNRKQPFIEFFRYSNHELFFKKSCIILTNFFKCKECIIDSKIHILRVMLFLLHQNILSNSICYESLSIVHTIGNESVIDEGLSECKILKVLLIKNDYSEEAKLFLEQFHGQGWDVCEPRERWLTIVETCLYILRAHISYQKTVEITLAVLVDLLSIATSTSIKLVTTQFQRCQPLLLVLEKYSSHTKITYDVFDCLAILQKHFSRSNKPFKIKGVGMIIHQSMKKIVLSTMLYPKNKDDMSLFQLHPILMVISRFIHFHPYIREVMRSGIFDTICDWLVMTINACMNWSIEVIVTNIQMIVDLFEILQNFLSQTIKRNAEDIQSFSVAIMMGLEDNMDPVDRMILLTQIFNRLNGNSGLLNLLVKTAKLVPKWVRMLQITSSNHKKKNDAYSNCLSYLNKLGEHICWCTFSLCNTGRFDVNRAIYLRREICYFLIGHRMFQGLPAQYCEIRSSQHSNLNYKITSYTQYLNYLNPEVNDLVEDVQRQTDNHRRLIWSAISTLTYISRIQRQNLHQDSRIQNLQVFRDLNQFCCLASIVGNIYEDSKLAAMSAELLVWYYHLSNGLDQLRSEFQILRNFIHFRWIEYNFDNDFIIVPASYKMTAIVRWEFDKMVYELTYNRRRNFLLFLTSYSLIKMNPYHEENSQYSVDTEFDGKPKGRHFLFHSWFKKNASTSSNHAQQSWIKYTASKVSQRLRKPTECCLDRQSSKYEVFAMKDLCAIIASFL